MLTAFMYFASGFFFCLAVFPMTAIRSAIVQRIKSDLEGKIFALDSEAGTLLMQMNRYRDVKARLDQETEELMVELLNGMSCLIDHPCPHHPVRLLTGVARMQKMREEL